MSYAQTCWAKQSSGKLKVLSGETKKKCKNKPPVKTEEDKKCQRHLNVPRKIKGRRQPSRGDHTPVCACISDLSDIPLRSRIGWRLSLPGQHLAMTVSESPSPGPRADRCNGTTSSTRAIIDEYDSSNLQSLPVSGVYSEDTCRSSQTHGSWQKNWRDITSSGTSPPPPLPP